MKKIVFLLAFFFLFIGVANAQQTVKKEALKSYQNPIIPGYNPDPSVCRVGDDYYLVTSTFEYFPGVPIYHSKDLVNWKIIGHAIHRADQLEFSDIPATHGVFAPTIRYHKGTFYMITTFVTQLQGQESRKEVKGGNFIVTAKNPAGPWSDPHWIENAPGIDPSLFFDDNGKVYYTGNRTPKEPIYRAQRAPSVLSKLNPIMKINYLDRL